MADKRDGGDESQATDDYSFLDDRFLEVLKVWSESGHTMAELSQRIPNKGGSGHVSASTMSELKANPSRLRYGQVLKIADAMEEATGLSAKYWSRYMLCKAPCGAEAMEYADAVRDELRDTIGPAMEQAARAMAYLFASGHAAEAAPALAALAAVTGAAMRYQGDGEGRNRVSEAARLAEATAGTREAARYGEMFEEAARAGLLDDVHEVAERTDDAPEDDGMG